MESSDDCTLRTKDILKIYSVSRATLRRRIDTGLFPRPFKDGRINFWMHSTVMTHLKKMEKDHSSNTSNGVIDCAKLD